MFTSFLVTQPPPAMCGKDSVQVIELQGKVTGFTSSVSERERVCVCVSFMATALLAHGPLLIF